MMEQAYQALKQYFGYDHFRTGQEELIAAILQHRDCLGIMPTGAGKSVCFQVPALLLPGITIVVSPLISLMKDQVNALTQAGVRAAFINSTLTDRQTYLALDNAKNGVYKIIYVAPERLESRGFLAFAQTANIAMVVVDEAHCISQWGQDFRPSYLNITAFLAHLPRRPILSAFTATATARVREDIINALALESPTLLVSGFDRSNLSFMVKQPKNKKTALLSFLETRRNQCGIIYCATRKKVEEVCQFLLDEGFEASRYHAGLPDQERHTNQEDFLHDHVHIMVATNAFGMGIDKSNVNFVVHYNMPADIESYYQEVGRAGRDGQPADCLLLYSSQDIIIHNLLIDHSNEPDQKQQSRKRLKDMAYFCNAADCLRWLILRYFGETAKESCNNCSNCLENLELTDVTTEAQKIISCVIKSGERYGAGTIVDVLRGSKSEKITGWGLDKLSTYNISTFSDRHLRDIIQYLTLHEFLYVSEGKYPTLSRGKRAADVLQGQTLVKIKLSSGQTGRQASPTKKAAQGEVNAKLFEALKFVRKEIATKQRVPAFVIFPDSTLVDMCRKMPQNEQDMLAVSGVGEVKLQKYGSIFLATIAGFVK